MFLKDCSDFAEPIKLIRTPPCSVVPSMADHARHSVTAPPVNAAKREVIVNA
ncbi:hypothetical protein A2U01_0037482 [Trifolium medium]|uniref:Uncharacterized protein n=1 Tax=Trifolium medium TaxID=97028 RepID=A0A392PY26_9FABA|nr:hypothetical protein [Trifolium medium]